VYGNVLLTEAVDSGAEISLSALTLFERQQEGQRAHKNLL